MKSVEFLSSEDGKKAVAAVEEFFKHPRQDCFSLKGLVARVADKVLPDLTPHFDEPQKQYGSTNESS